MRRFYLTLCMLLCLMVGAHAQRSIAFGLKAGANLATIDGKDVDDSPFRIGYHLGAMINAPIALGVSLQPEVLLSLKGAGKIGTNNDNLNLLYLDIPIMAKVMLGERFNLQFGPYGSLLLNAKQGDTGVKSTIRNFDTGVALGLGYVFADRLTFDARYMYGLSKVYDNELLGDYEAGNRALQLSLGFLLGGNR